MKPAPLGIIIITHGRPDNLVTLRTLEREHWTGPVHLLIDDEDETLPQYLDLYGDQVIVFPKQETARLVDLSDNLATGGSSAIARAAVWKAAADLGYRYFILLDDDYTTFRTRWNNHLIKENTQIHLDRWFTTIAAWFQTLPETIVSVSCSQSGDWIGGEESYPDIIARRKAMNLFFLDTHRPFPFPGRLNEDVTAYTEVQRRGRAFLTLVQLQLEQLASQQNPGGLSDAYIAAGTYTKSFYSVMRCPSAVKISHLRDNKDGGATSHPRIHHRVNYNHCAPKIVSQHHQK